MLLDPDGRLMTRTYLEGGLRSPWGLHLPFMFLLSVFVCVIGNVSIFQMSYFDCKCYWSRSSSVVYDVHTQTRKHSHVRAYLPTYINLRDRERVWEKGMEAEGKTDRQSERHPASSNRLVLPFKRERKRIIDHKGAHVSLVQGRHCDVRLVLDQLPDHAHPRAVFDGAPRTIGRPETLFSEGGGGG